jgi:hypothetical protein
MFIPMEQVILWTCLAFALAITLFLLREDWFHLTRPVRQVLAHVIGHRQHMDKSSPSFAALLEFTGPDGTPMQVEDKLLSSNPTPAIGSIITIHHPEGMPQRARIRRPILRAAIYLLLFYLIAVLAGRLAGFLSAPRDVSGI